MNLSARLEALQESIIPVWVYDHDTFRVRWANQSAVELWRATSLTELLQRDLSDWNPTAPVPVTEEMRDLVEASPTKNATVAQAMYDALEAEGAEWVFVPTELSNQDTAAWTEFRALVTAGGGQKVRHSYAGGGRPIKGNVYDLRGALRVRVDGDHTKWLASGQITGEQSAASDRRARAIYANAASSIKPFAKYGV